MSELGSIAPEIEYQIVHHLVCRDPHPISAFRSKPGTMLLEVTSISQQFNPPVLGTSDAHGYWYPCGLAGTGTTGTGTGLQILTRSQPAPATAGCGFELGRICRAPLLYSTLLMNRNTLHQLGNLFPKQRPACQTSQTSGNGQ